MCGWYTRLEGAYILSIQDFIEKYGVLGLRNLANHSVSQGNEVVKVDKMQQ
jgi:hypothetical protein